MQGYQKGNNGTKQAVRGGKAKTEEEEKREKISRGMSKILRHKLVERGIPFTEDGYVAVTDLMKQGEMKGTRIEDIYDVVKTNDKQRFSIITKNTDKGDVVFVRANQGHSSEVGEKLNVDELLEEIKQPIGCFHGTNTGAVGLIMKNGLSRMARSHIHFAVGRPGDKEVISGMRRSVNVIFSINMDTAMKKGHTFYMSANKVILTEGPLLPDPELYLEIEVKCQKNSHRANTLITGFKQAGVDQKMIDKIRFQE